MKIEEFKKDFKFKQLCKSFEVTVEKMLKKDTELNVLINRYKETATNGDLKAREVFKNFLKGVFLEGVELYEFNEEELEPDIVLKVTSNEMKKIIDWIIPFNDIDLLDARQKFLILLIKYRKINEIGYDEAFNYITENLSYTKIKKDNLGLKNISYEYTEKDIDKIYLQSKVELAYEKKVDVVVQMLYEELYGLKSIDSLAYSNVNEVCVGNSGKYIYCWDKEKIRLRFLELTESEVEIIQNRSTSFDDKIGELCVSNPEVVCFRADQARVQATQPPYTSARELNIRIFNKKNADFSELITDYKQQLLIQVIVKAGQNISLQGDLGAGKSTTMQTLYQIMEDSIHIGTIEETLEQHNRLKNPDKRVIETQVVDGKSLEDCFKTLLRSSVDAAGLGEAREGKAFFTFLQLAQAIKNSTFLTGHVASPKDTVPRYTNMLLATGNYFSEQAAVRDIVNYIDVVFQHSIIDNQRCIQDIVEIIPMGNNESDVKIGLETDKEVLEKLALIQQIQQNPTYMYRLNPIMELENGEFIFKNYPSDKMLNAARANGYTDLVDRLLEIIKQDVI